MIDNSVKNSNEIDTCDENNKLKLNNESEEKCFEEQAKTNKIFFILLGISVIISIVLGILIYIQANRENPLLAKLERAQNIQDANNQLNQTNITIRNIEYKPFELRHYRPENFDLKYYSEYLPKNKNDIKIKDLQEIFNDKYLYIKNPKISFDYIYLIRQKDFENEGQRNTSILNDTTNYFTYEPKNGQISVLDFYELCEDETINAPSEKKSYKKPLISVIIALYNKNQNLLRTIKSIQHQSLKNIEIIIVDDKDINLYKNFSSIIESDRRIRVFIQETSFGLWRKRMDGFLYSKGKYILHMDAGHTLSDNLILEDIYNLSEKYSLDAIRFSFSKTVDDENFVKDKKFGNITIYPCEQTKLTYGRPDYDVHNFGYGTIWNRLVKADMFSKGLDLVDSVVLNINKNLWEDMWWNDLVDRVSFSNLIINRLGYIFLDKKNITIEPLIRTEEEKDKTIREFIYFWYFDYVLLPKDNDKKVIVKTLHKFNDTNNTVCDIPMKLSFLGSKSLVFKLLVKQLLQDSYVAFFDKIYIKDLSDYIKSSIKEKQAREKANKKMQINEAKESIKKETEESKAKVEKAKNEERKTQIKLQVQKEPQKQEKAKADAKNLTVKQNTQTNVKIKPENLKENLNNTYINKVENKTINNLVNNQMNNNMINNNAVQQNNQYNNMNNGQNQQNMIQNQNQYNNIYNNQLVNSGNNQMNQRYINNNIDPALQNNNILNNNIKPYGQYNQQMNINQPYPNNPNNQFTPNNQFNPNNLYYRNNNNQQQIGYNNAFMNNQLNNQNNQQNINNNMNNNFNPPNRINVFYNQSNIGKI